MSIADLHPLLLVVDQRNQVLKVSEVEKASVTVEVVYPIPPRTTIRRLTEDEIALLRPASTRMVTAYERAWGLAPL